MAKIKEKSRNLVQLNFADNDYFQVKGKVETLLPDSYAVCRACRLKKKIILRKKGSDVNEKPTIVRNHN